MQPEPSAASTVTSTQTRSPEDIHHRKHGLHRPDSTTDDMLPADHVIKPSTPTQDDQLAFDAAVAASLQETASRHSSDGAKLKKGGTPSPPGRNRIAEYEQASTPPVRRREGPAFEVIKRQRSEGDTRSMIQELPNEVLTHALAHLSPTDLTSVSLVSKRFHTLVTGPHAWRSAFAHYFPGPDTLDPNYLDSDDDGDVQVAVRTEKRVFTRLTALASWRSEYIMRTRLLRSLARGKPAQASGLQSPARGGSSHTAAPIVMYYSQLPTTINHLDANFGNSSSSKKGPKFVHGADDFGTATSSDPNTSKVDSWGLSDPQMFLQFAERFPGDAQYGLGPGDVVGVPNVMDVSQSYGMIHGEGSPGGMVYYRSTEEMRGRFLTFSSAMSVPALGIPRIASTNEAMTSVWIAKSSAIPSLTEGSVGMLSASSLGVVTAYSLGSTGNGASRDQRFARGEMTARWVLSPGVPIIALAVDNEYSLSRHAQNRIWIVALNALGEVFYLTKFPKRPHVERGTRLDDESIERTAWLTGRSVGWSIMEPSRRSAKPDPYAESGADGSYTPRTSWNGMCLSEQQIQAETLEIADFATRKPHHLQKACTGWDMRRKLEVDFAGDDGNNAGENIVVIECGLEEGSSASVKRYARYRIREKTAVDSTTTPPLTSGSTQASNSPSLFGGATSPVGPTPTFSFDRLADSLSQDDFKGSTTPRPMTEEWRVTQLSLHGIKHAQITASALDKSTFATQTISEDPLLGFTGPSNASSPAFTPMSPTGAISEPADMPGQRARLLAIGTGMGTVLLWNVRAPSARSAEVINTIEPVRMIITDSPQISCLALSSLYIVVGGNDGLVQAWDVLGSSMQPTRTLHSRSSAKARRRLVQAQASAQGVGINMFAAGAICVDPDPTVLRGVVSLGNHLRYWSYSSSAADQYKSSKRRLRRSERGSNNGGERFSGATRTNLKGYIENEKYELEREKKQREKDAQRFAGRFGTELLDGSEEEMMAYAALLSQETLEQENLLRGSDASTVASTADSTTDHSTGQASPAGSPSPRFSTPKTDDELDADIAEAIRQSLASSPSKAYDIPIRHAKPKKRSTPRQSPRPSPLLAGSSQADEMSDLEFALQLSLVEEETQLTDPVDEFPALGGGRSNGGKGKGRAKY